MIYDAVVFLLVVDALANLGSTDDTGLPPDSCSGLYLPGVSTLDLILFNGTGTPRFSYELITTPKLTAEPALMPYAQ